MSSDRLTNFASSGVLYDWPFAVWENIKYVRGHWWGWDGEGVGEGAREVSTSSMGVSLMPRMICASSAVDGTMVAPAYKAVRGG